MVSWQARPSRFSRAQNSLSQNSLSLPFQTPATQANVNLSSLQNLFCNKVRHVTMSQRVYTLANQRLHCH